MFDILSSIIPFVSMIINNGTLPTITIPATLTPVLGSSSTNSNTILDVTTVSGIVALITAAYAGIKDHAGNKQSDNRTTALVNNQERTVNSLKSSDLGAKDDAMGVNALVMKLCENPDLAKLLQTPTDINHGIYGKSVADFVKDQAAGWEKSNKEYYDNSVTLDTDTSKDPVIRKAAEITKLTTPTIQ
jgi:hypothetical protein